MHVVDQWRYLGSFAEDESAPAGLRPGPFDADAYRILARYLKPGLRGVRPLGPAPARRAHDGCDT